MVIKNERLKREYVKMNKEKAHGGALTLEVRICGPPLAFG